MRAANHWTSRQVARFPDRLLFDVATSVTPKAPEVERARIARRLREFGLGRVLYGSDAATPGNAPRDGWAAYVR